MNRSQVIAGWELWQWRNLAIKAATAAHVSSTEVDWLLQQVTGLDRLVLRLETFKDWSRIEIELSLEDLEQLWQQRLHDRLPVQYIAKVAHWRQFKLAVAPGVLIPRPETEYLIDLAVLATGNSNQIQGQWADLGTGSGAIALGLAAAFKDSIIHAVDVSPTALSIARKNAEALGFANRIHFYQGDWWEPLEFLQGELSGVVANPPYIPSLEIQYLQPEVAWHEPHLALDGGKDGLDAIRHLVKTSPAYLRSGGVFLIEMMAGQDEQVVSLLQDESYCNIEVHPDLAGIKRYALARRC